MRSRGLILLAAVAVAVTLNVAASVYAQADARTERALNAWLAQARREVERGRRDRAQGLYLRALRRAPDDPRAADALEHLLFDVAPERVASPSPAERALAAELADALGRRSTPAGAPPNGEVTARRAWLIAASGDHRGAIELVTAVPARLDEAVGRALRRLATLAVARRDLVAASTALAAARRVDPASPELPAEHAAVLLARGHAAHAEPILRDALTRRPDDVRLRRDLGSVLLALGRAREASTIFDAIARDTGESEAWLDAARAAREGGDLEATEVAARAAMVGAAATDVEPWLVLAGALQVAGERHRAEAVLREAIARAPRSARASEALAALERSRAAGDP